MEPLEACRRALELGLRAIVFTEHMDFDPSDEGFGFYDAVAIRDSLDTCRRAFPGLRIFKGVEVTFQSKYRKQIERFLKKGGFEYSIGSVHMVGQGDISRAERQSDYFSGKSEEEAYRPYFEEVRLAAESGLFDAIGHLDLCKKYGIRHYGPLDWRRYAPEIEGILREAASKGCAIELNTSGTRQDPQDTYPNLGVIELFRRMGGRVLLGSDAHRTVDIGHAFEQYENRVSAV
jgi:histidinol-phosphatase (PHP family)